MGDFGSAPGQGILPVVSHFACGSWVGECASMCIVDHGSHGVQCSNFRSKGFNALQSTPSMRVTAPNTCVRNSSGNHFDLMSLFSGVLHDTPRPEHHCGLRMKHLTANQLVHSDHNLMGPPWMKDCIQVFIPSDNVRPDHIRLGNMSPIVGMCVPLNWVTSFF